MNRKTVILTIMTIIGNIIIAFGISLLNLSGLGMDAFTAMNLGVSTLLGVGLGIYQALFNIVLLIPVLIFNKKALGIGSIINMFLLGYVVQGFMSLWASLGLTTASLGSIFIQIIVLVIGILFICFGCAVYMECDLGVGPYDALAPIISDKTGISFKYTRIMTDLTSAIVGLIAGMLANITTIGITTVLVVAGTGPLISFFREKFIQPFYNKLVYTGA